MTKPHRSERKSIGRGAGTTDSRWWCSKANKKRYPDKRAAERAKRTIINRHSDRSSLPKRCYECEDCKGWHHTSWETPGGPQTGL